MEIQLSQGGQDIANSVCQEANKVLSGLQAHTMSRKQAIKSIHRLVGRAEDQIFWHFGLSGLEGFERQLLKDRTAVDLTPFAGGVTWTYPQERMSSGTFSDLVNIYAAALANIANGCVNSPDLVARFGGAKLIEGVIKSMHQDLLWFFNLDTPEKPKEVAKKGKTKKGKKGKAKKGKNKKQKADKKQKKDKQHKADKKKKKA